jgi:hypothetical protein
VRNASKYKGDVGFNAALRRSGGWSKVSHFAMLRRPWPVRRAILEQDSPVQGVNHLEHHVPRLSMSEAHPAPMRCRNVPIILNRIDLRAPDTFIGQQCPPRGAARKAHPLLDCDPQVVHEMEPISHLARLRRTLANSLRIKAAAIPADDLDGRVLSQPLGRSLDTAVIQNVDNRATLEINHDGPVSCCSSPAPVIDANHPNLGCAVSNRGISLQLPQDGVVADRHAEPLHQALARTAARAMAEQADNLHDPRRPARIRGSNLRQSVGERLSLTFLMSTSPAAQQELHRHGLAPGPADPEGCDWTSHADFGFAVRNRDKCRLLVRRPKPPNRRLQ